MRHIENHMGNRKRLDTKAFKKAFTLVELLVIIAVISIIFIAYISKVDFATYKAKDAGVLTDFHSYELAINAVTREHGEFKQFNSNADFILELNKNLDSRLKISESEPHFSSDINIYNSKYELKLNSIDNTVELYAPKGLASSGLFAFGAEEVQTEVYVGLVGVYAYSDTPPENECILKVTNFNKAISKQSIIKTPNTPVESAMLDRIELDHANVKKSYTLGDIFDTSGLIVNAYYSDGTIKEIADYIVETSILNDAEQTNIMVKYQDKVDYIPITITINNTLGIGTIYNDGDYEYRYGQYFNGIAWVNNNLNGWGVSIIASAKSKSSYIQPLEVINGAPVVNYNHLFYNHPATDLTLVGTWTNSNVLDMTSIFRGSKAIVIDGLTRFGTKSVTNMSHMFFGSQASSLDVSSFDTSKVTNMAAMFGDTKATTLNIGNLNTSSVKEMSSMFNKSEAVTLDLKAFDTSNVTQMVGMFGYSKASELDLSSFDTSNVLRMSMMFNNSEATSINISSFNTTNVTDMYNMFRGTKVTTIDLSSFDTRNVTGMDCMFQDSLVTTLDLSNFNTSKVTKMNNMFENCKATTINLSSFNTINVTNMGSMFAGSKATVLDLSSFNTSKVTYLNSMFAACSATTGYARISSDATKFNNSSNRPTYLLFTVKP